MAITTAKRVADYIVAFSHEHGDPVSNLKLQKLVYYAQAWYLALYGEVLFDERIEAWVHGPVVAPLYGSYKGWAWQPIDENIELSSIDLPASVKAHLDEVMDIYGGLTAYDLEKLTHSETPCQKARGDIPPDEPSNAIIAWNDMKVFYERAANAQNP